MEKALLACASFDARLAQIVIKSAPKAAYRARSVSGARKRRTFLCALCENQLLS
jgi:hypothetical protein